MQDLVERLTRKSADIRRSTLETCIRAGTGHVTSSFSCIEILVTLYYGNLLMVDPAKPEWDGRDRFILSKGQASPALYAILGDLGFFDVVELEKFAQEGGMFGVHLQNTVPGVEITAGSLGQGFGVAAGQALAAKMNRQNHLVFALLGDGECYEGSIWETALFAGHHELNNLVTIVDRNYLCVTDFTEDLIRLEPIEEKWQSFGFKTVRINGHNIEEIIDALKGVRSRTTSKPLVIIADTVKGKGIESISNKILWHGAAPSGDFADQARAELERSIGQ